MDGSDDYGFDDFILDPQALAALDQAESQFQQSIQAPAQPEAESSNTHINKRIKTSKGWTAGAGAKPVSTDYDDDCLPEISVRGDGTYGLGTAPTRPVAELQRSVYQGRTSPSSAPGARTPDSSSSRSIPRTKAAQTIRPQLVQRAAPRRNEPVRQVAPNPAPPRQEQSLPPSDAYLLQSQIQELQKKLEEIRQENAQTQAALKNAIEVKLTKEGEVSVLRRTIEKNSQNHAAHIAQLKTEKEKSDAKQAQMQKDMKEGMERLRTQFSFKQQELEASTRKPPMSSRAKRIGREFPSTPIAVPSVMRQWQASQSTSRRTLEETPLRTSRPLGPPVTRVSPMKGIRESPVKPRKNPPLGFQNAFDTSTPMRSPSKRSKGKTKQQAPAFTDEPRIPPLTFSQQIPAEPPSQLIRSSPAPALPSSNNDLGPDDAAMFDQEMEVITQETEVDAMVLDELDPINWKAELCRTFLTHRHLSSEEITFQRLLSCSPLVPDREMYSAACSKILVVLATSTRSDDYQESIRSVSNSLLIFVCVLYRSNQLEPLVILLDFMTKLVAYLPLLSFSLLTSAHSTGPGDSSTSLGDMLRTIVQEQLTPDKMESLNRELANEILTLLETLSLYLLPDSVPGLQHFVRNRNVILVLLQIKQPDWFLERSTRLLVLLASHHGLWESLLGFNDDDLKNVVVDRLCSLIVDMSKPATAVYKINILIFIAQIAMSDSAAHEALVKSHTLIPSLLLFTSYLATPLWEDDDQLMCSEEQLASVTRLLNQILFLLYHLIFSTNPCVSLADKIQQAPTRAFNCLIHLFTVTFGRLGYCDAPSWMDPKNSRELESMAEVARDILELVFDGPEGDTIWGTFQSDQDEDNELDEDEF